MFARSARGGAIFFLLVLLTSTLVGRAEELQLELVPLERGHRLSAFGDVPERFRQTAAYRAAAAVGLDLIKPDHPYLSFAHTGKSGSSGRLFYLFYNDVVQAPSEGFLLQRLKQTKTEYLTDGSSASQTTYLVEAIKLLNGRSKRPDQHFGSYGIRSPQRRVIQKEFEVGIGTIPTVASGPSWPFDAGILYKQIQAHQSAPGIYDQVEFTQSYRWTITVTLDLEGNYELLVPDLEIKVVRQATPKRVAH